MRFKPGYGPGGYQRRSRKADRATASLIGQIRGTTLVGSLGIVMPNVIINVYTRNWVLQGTTVSDASGLFLMTGLIAGTEYYLIAVDPDGGPRYDIKAHTVTAVAAYRGLDVFYSSLCFGFMMDGTHGSTSFPDLGPYGLTSTVGGNASITTAVTPPFSTACGTFDASGDYLFVPPPLVNAGSILSGTNSTIDFWARWQVANGFTSAFFQQNLAGTVPALNIIGGSGGSSIQIRIPGGGILNVGGPLGFPSIATTRDNWWHLALVTSAGVARFFINGVWEGNNSAIASSGFWTTFTTGYLVGTHSNLVSMNGQMKGFRATNAVRWPGTASFTPPVLDAEYRYAA